MIKIKENKIEKQREKIENDKGRGALTKVILSTLVHSL